MTFDRALSFCCHFVIIGLIEHIYERNFILDQLLCQLNQKQLEAVTSTEGFIRVIAGAGSGKTRALSHRFAFLVNEIGILPGNILCVTFTNKAANEMRHRIHNLIADNDTGYINTFHGFCVSILQEDSHAVQYPKNFLVLDNQDIDSMLKIIYEERGLTLRHKTFSKARDMIEMYKLERYPNYYLDLITMSLDTLRQKYLGATDVNDIIFYGYLYQEKKCFGLDYNDLLKFSLYIFEKNKEIRLKWQKRLEYIMIDEFQDIDKIQYQLMKVLCGYHKNLFIVGDPDQTIYSWRGADINYLLNFDKAFPDVKTIMMNENYRSTPQILSVCNSLIDKNKNRMKKDLLPMCHSKNSVLYYHGDTSEEESDWIADQIIKLHKKDISYKDITILYRAHYVTRTLEETLLKKKIPYSIYSGIQFFERMEVKDALSYLRMITYKDDLSFLRIVNVPKRNIGKKRMEFLQAYVNAHHCSFYEALKECVEDPIFKGTDAKDFISLIDAFSVTYEQRTISEVLSDILDRSGYEEMLRTTGNQERLDNLAELKQAVYDYEISCGEEALLPDYLDHIALFTNSDVTDDSDKVKLMTVHAAKGLEFPHVFLCALNEGIFPSKKTSTIEGMEEERRLAFVAMSRAMKSLFLSESHGKNFDGSTRYPSRFILDIDQKFLEYVKKPEDTLIAETKNYIHYSNRYLDGYVAEQTFQVGDKIIHNVFGQGRIKSILSDRNAYMIKFEQIETPRIISFRVPIKRA